jgi:diphosphomevalonate decarboxylase
MTKFETTWQAPSNIALIKYWGKHGNQLPNNPSLSITLREARTATRLRAEPAALISGEPETEYFFEGHRVAGFEERVKGFLKKIGSEMPFLTQYKLVAESSNTFPHSAGIASSASSMAALALCLTSLEQEHLGITLEREEFFRRASFLARLGSGSASRSVYGGYASWGNSGVLPGSSDEYATPYQGNIHPMFDHPGVAILLVSSDRKPVSSSLGHKLMESHPFSKARYTQAHDHLSQLKTAMETGDFGEFARIVENEALTLHSLLMTSSPEGLLMKPGSLEIIHKVREFRKTTGVPVCFTLDAGPNVLLIYPNQVRDKVVTFIKEQLVPYCEKGQWMDDGMGDGPEDTARSYPSKILLFGEYGILSGSMALAIPYPMFGGTFRDPVVDPDEEILDFQAASNEHLKQLAQFLSARREEYAYLDLDRLWQDLELKWWFDSDIPQGYGSGSSGALTAALFDRYAFPGAKDGTLVEIREKLASIEKFFHGTSSGLDPLVSLTQKPVLIDDDGTAGCLQPDFFKIDPPAAIFLVDTGTASKTGNHVAWYLEQNEDFEFRRAVNEVYIPAIRQAIVSLTAQKYHSLEEAFGQISSFQMQYLHPMIPPHFSDHFGHGLYSGDFYLKLCGSGGGGFMLGVTRDIISATKYFRENNVEILKVT